jgi:DNA polymerase
MTELALAGELWTFDFETYFSKDYTLKSTNMTTEGYVRDERFEALGLAVTHGKEQWWIPGPFIQRELDKLDWSKINALAYHAQFDGLILSHHYNKRPRGWYDTLAMARAKLGVHLSNDLGSLAERFGLSPKSVPYNEFKGKRYAEIITLGNLFQRLGAGAVHDAMLCREIFNQLAVDFPESHLQAIDTTVRMFTEPVLELDLPMLGQIWQEEEQRRRGALASLGVTESALQSSATFAAILESLDVEIEYKDGKNGPIPCFAKTDRFMEELCEHPNERISLLAQTRLGLRSTIDQTRASRLGWMARRGLGCVYLKFGGAHTLRWSGGDKVNWQNLRRGGKLRKTVKAPQGCTLVVADSSQIECRVLNCFAGQEDVVEKFRNGEDPYLSGASAVYGRPITKADKAERGTGKQLELSCGFGAGAATIQKTARLGTYGPPVDIDLVEAERWKQIYRQTHLCVQQVWKEAEVVLARMFNWRSFEWRCLEVRCDEATGKRRITVPGELPLIYDSLEWHIPTEVELAKWSNMSPGWQVKTRKGSPTKMYGAKLIENVVQYMAFVILKDIANRISAHGIKIATTTHDEIVTVVPVDKGEATRQILEREFCVAPSWMPDLPLGVECIVSERYEK